MGAHDSDRPLSARGRSDVEAVASFLKHQDISVSRVVHSTLTRARETAEILATALAPDGVMEEMDGIEPWGDVRAFVRGLVRWDEDTMVCGHEPFMGETASMLMTGRAGGQVVTVKTGAVMAFNRSPFGPNWQMRWMIKPRLVRGPKPDED